jgi:hypothetical protein
LIRLTGISFCQCKMHSADCAQCMSSSSHSRHFQENSAFASRRKSIAASSTVEQGGVLDEPNSAPGTSSPSWAGGRTAASASGRRPWRPGRRRSQLGKRTATLPGGRADGSLGRVGGRTDGGLGWASRRWPQLDGRTGTSVNGWTGPRRTVDRGLGEWADCGQGPQRADFCLWVGAADVCLWVREEADFCFGSLLPCKRHCVCCLFWWTRSHNAQ